MGVARNTLVAIVRLLLSAVFLLSAAGKLLDINGSAFNMSQLLLMPIGIARIFVIAWSLLELGLVGLIWWRVPRLLLLLPVAFAGVLGLGYARDTSCGCFGALPVLSQFPPFAHLLLIIGIFLGFLYLSRLPGDSGLSGTAASSPALGWSAASLIALAFVLVPFFGDPHGSATGANGVASAVDRAFVQQAIATQSHAIIDARSELQFTFGHIPGAISVPADSPDLESLIERHNLREQKIIAYCSSAQCDLAERLAEKLIALGCEEVVIYTGGWEEWELAAFGGEG